MNCQIVHDSIHRRAGWTRSYLLELDGSAVGFASVAIDGPWKDKPTFFESYLLPEYRSRIFQVFDAFLSASGARFFEVQSNDLLTTALALACADVIATEKIVFRDSTSTTLAANGARLRSVTPAAEVLQAIEHRQGGGEWVLELDGRAVGKGGILFHYNRPYGDIYMEIVEAFRKRGFGGYLVQELKRVCYELGAIPAARCNPTNIASRGTLLRAGFAPEAHILYGGLRRDAIRAEARRDAS